MTEHALETYDVIVVGGGPAGLSAALVLGRCRRRVLVLDDCGPRNARSRAAHGFYTRDGATPGELRQIAIEQLEPYSVTVQERRVTSARRIQGGFFVESQGANHQARKLLLATGLRDRVLNVPGADALACAGVYQCPYCDGWEVRDRVLGVYAPCDNAAELALGLLTWSRDVVLFTGKAVELSGEDRAQLARHRVRVYDSLLAEVVGRPGELDHVRLASGECVKVEALFLHHGQEPRSPLAEELGCAVEPNGAVRASADQRTNVPGLFVAGDVASGVQSIAVSAAEGYRAAIAINRELREEDFA